MKAVQETTFGKVFQPWPLKPLPDVAFFQEGPGLRKWQWTDSGMKVVNVTNILGDGTVDVNNTARFISSEEYETKYRHFTVDDGDIVVASSGNTYGKVGRINKSHLPLMMNTSVIRFHPAEPKQLEQDFLFAFLRSDLFKNQMESFVIGSAQPNFGPSHLKRMVIPCPPLPTQRKIASILSAYDDLIENNTRRIAILEEMAQAIYREWFVNFRFPGHENVKLVDSPLGQIPEGWEIVPLSDLTNAERKITYGVVKPGDHDPDGVRFVRGGDILGGQVDVNALRTITNEVSKQYKRTLLQGGELIVSLVGNPGEVAIAPKSLAGANIARQVGLVVIDDPMTTVYVKNYLMSSHGKDELFAHTTGSVQKVINLANLKMVRIIRPPSSMLNQTMPIFDDNESQVQTLRIKNHNLRTTRDLLLPKLISGKLDVEDLDIDTGLTAETLEEATA